MGGKRSQPMQKPATAHDRRETALPFSEQKGSGTACCATNVGPPAETALPFSEQKGSGTACSATNVGPPALDARNGESPSRRPSKSTLVEGGY